MMVFGLQLFDDSGSLILDISNTLTREVYQTVVSAGVSGSIDLSDIDGLETCEFSFPIVSSDIKYFASDAVSRSGTIISWSPPPSDTAIVDCVIYVFLYT